MDDNEKLGFSNRRSSSAQSTTASTGYMKKCPWESIVRRLLPNVNADGSSGTEVWLFGSACSYSNPRDIDILIAYDPLILSTASAIDLRGRLAEAVFADTGQLADILLLSRDEV